LLKNARLILTVAPEVAAYVKAAVPQAFNDEPLMIRNAAGQDVIAFLDHLEPRAIGQSVSSSS
jgi:transportin-1